MCECVCLLASTELDPLVIRGPVCQVRGAGIWAGASDEQQGRAGNQGIHECVRVCALLNVEGVVYVSSLVTFSPEQLERWKGTHLPTAVFWVSVTCGCCERKVVPCLWQSVQPAMSGHVSLGRAFSLATGSTCKWKRQQPRPWPRTETSWVLWARGAVLQHPGRRNRWVLELLEVVATYSIP